MPDLEPRDGWTKWSSLSSLDPDQARGTIDDTPCKGFQWYYGIKEDLGTGFHHWIVRMEITAADGQTVLYASTLDLPIHVADLGPFGRLWYVQNEKITTTFPTSFQTWENRAEQPILVYPAGYDGTGPVEFDVYTAPYLIPLPAGALFKIRHGEIGNTNLRFRPVLTSVLPAGGRKQMLVDPVTGDQHLPRIENGMLTVRTVAHDGMVGRRSGLVVTYGGGVVTATAGRAVIGWQECTAATELKLSLGTSEKRYIYLQPNRDGGIDLVAEAGPVARAAWCVGRVSNGRFASCDGVLIADGVDVEPPFGRREDGTLVIRYDTAGARDVAAVSRDRGVTWE